MSKLCLGLMVSFFLLTQNAFADGEELAPPFKDIRVGERNNVSRVAVVCAGGCAAERDADGRFFLAGVSGSLDIDLSKKENFVVGLTIEDLGSGAFLTVRTQAQPSAVKIANCTGQVICIDFVHPERVAQAVPAKSVPGRSAPAKKMPPAAPRIEEKPTAQNKRTEVAEKAVTEVAGSPVSEERIRWSPVIAQALEPVAPRPLLRTTCPEYQNRLRQDAWDLDAYRMVALCQAAQGDIQKAELLLGRLLTVYPDDPAATEAVARLAEIRMRPGRPSKVALRDDF